MKLKWILPIIGLAIGIALIAVGTIIIGENSTVSLGKDEDGYFLWPQSEMPIQVGVLTTASGVIAVSVSLASMMIFWKRNSQLDATQTQKEE